MSVEKIFEVTFMDPVSAEEFKWFEEGVAREGVLVALASSGRIMTFAGIEEVESLIQYLGEYLFADSVAHIREIIDYEVEWEELGIIVEFEN